MYAIVDIAGQQFKVKKNDVIFAQKLGGDAGSELELDKVMLLASDQDTKVGAPYIEGAKVTATIVEHKKDKKVLVFKKKRRKTYRVLNGHRQLLTALQITDIIA